jgi:phosphate transport system substrate-binding protein
MKYRLLTAALAAGLITLPVRAAEIVGTGATFPAKVYAQWAEQYGKSTGVSVKYAGTGSGQGVKQISARAVDFGATDVPMSAAELDKAKLFQFPTLVGGVVPVVHLPGLADGTLRLTGEVLARIFSGQIARWNDPAIAQLNPGLRLTALPITRIVRADHSGTTEVFVAYLGGADASAAASLPRKGGASAWPGTVMAVEGSAKVAQTVRDTPGAIGYISSDYVLREKLVPVSLRNRSGEWIKPDVASYRAAVRAGKLFADSLEAKPLLDLEGAGVWPIVTATYVVVDRSPQSLERSAQTLSFFYEAFLQGDRAVAGSGFAPLPPATQARIVGALANFRSADGQRVPLMAAPR